MIWELSHSKLTGNLDTCPDRMAYEVTMRMLYNLGYHEGVPRGMELLKSDDLIVLLGRHKCLL